ncbi:MAG: hypothetical protein R3C14_26780 [Caldilineaceae bacterium]
MNRHIMRGAMREMRGELKRNWGKFTYNDRSRLEGELDRVIGLLQKRYGYTRQRAAKELTRYVNNYGERVRTNVGGPFGQLRTKPLRIFMVLWGAAVAVGATLLLLRLRPQFNAMQEAASNAESTGMQHEEQQYEPQLEH